MKNKNQKTSVTQFSTKHGKKSGLRSGILYVDIARAGRLAALMEMDQFAIPIDAFNAAARKTKRSRAA
jgi:hypothetical protein